MTFTVRDADQGVSTDPVTAASPWGGVCGNIAQARPLNSGTLRTACTGPRTLASGESFTCEVDVVIDGNAHARETDTVTAAGTDDENTPVSATGSAAVTIMPAGEPTSTDCCAFDRDPAVDGDGPGRPSRRTRRPGRTAS